MKNKAKSKRRVTTTFDREDSESLYKSIFKTPKPLDSHMESFVPIIWWEILYWPFSLRIVSSRDNHPCSPIAGCPESENTIMTHLLIHCYMNLKLGVLNHQLLIIQHLDHENYLILIFRCYTYFTWFLFVFCPFLDKKMTRNDTENNVKINKNICVIRVMYHQG